MAFRDMTTEERDEFMRKIESGEIRIKPIIEVVPPDQLTTMPIIVGFEAMSDDGEDYFSTPDE